VKRISGFGKTAFVSQRSFQQYPPKAEVRREARS
jgi:hypothetical protein